MKSKRIARAAFDAAMKRRKHVTSVDKATYYKPQSYGVKP